MKIPKIDAVNAAKKILSSVVGIGTTRIVYNVIANNTSPSKPFDKVAFSVASMVLGAMVSDAASEYTDTKIDEVVEMVREIKEKL